MTKLEKKKIKELVIATKNKKKLEEIRFLLKDLPIKVTSLKDYPLALDINENGKTFIENAEKKAVHIARFIKKLTLGEDSGLEVDYLGGAPGIYSSRFSGKEKNDLINNLKLLRLLRNLSFSKRTAHYTCAIVLADQFGVIKRVRGECFGKIGFELQGELGFGYDPLFVANRYNKTFAQVNPIMKHRISHRTNAIRKIRRHVLEYFKRDL